jgi:hypothetical protein
VNAPARSFFDPADRERIAELEEEVAWLRGELGLCLEATRIDAVMRGCRIPPGPARMLLALHDAGGRVLTVAALEAVLHGQGDDLVAGSKLVGSQVWAVRARIGPGVIRNAWGLGYAITPAGAARVREALGG